MNEKTLRNGKKKMCTRNFLMPCLLCLLLLPVAAKPAEQKAFATPAEAVQALVKASEDENQEEMLAVFGDDGKDLVYSGDSVQDKARMRRFVQAYNTKHAIVKQGENTRILEVGASNWPMPIPLVNEGGRWRFDTVAGKQELLFRRIGRNELGAIAACRGFIDAQKDYAAVSHDGLPAGIYAQKLMSDPGQQNGLYWETKEDEPASPAGPFLAKAGSEGYRGSAGSDESQPYHGYLYRILTAQGPAAKGGAKSYLSDGRLTAGVALVAYPAQYKVSGVMTFIINQRGVPYQKDLGENTLDLAAAMTEYNPDSTWTKVTN
jgi:Protein of unknown function (DUF2950)